MDSLLETVVAGGGGGGVVNLVDSAVVVLAVVDVFAKLRAAAGALAF